MIYFLIISASVVWCLFSLYSPRLSHLDGEFSTDAENPVEKPVEK